MLSGGSPSPVVAATSTTVLEEGRAMRGKASMELNVTLKARLRAMRPIRSATSCASVPTWSAMVQIAEAAETTHLGCSCLTSIKYCKRSLRLFGWNRSCSGHGGPQSDGVARAFRGGVLRLVSGTWLVGLTFQNSFVELNAVKSSRVCCAFRVCPLQVPPSAYRTCLCYALGVVRTSSLPPSS